MTQDAIEDFYALFGSYLRFVGLNLKMLAEMQMAGRTME